MTRPSALQSHGLGHGSQACESFVNQSKDPQIAGRSNVGWSGEFGAHVGVDWHGMGFVFYYPVSRSLLRVVLFPLPLHFSFAIHCLSMGLRAVVPSLPLAWNPKGFPGEASKTVTTTSRKAFLGSFPSNTLTDGPPLLLVRHFVRSFRVVSGMLLRQTVASFQLDLVKCRQPNPYPYSLEYQI
ncbi:hypothetical protein PTI98_012149 [Pleurotus ostreatus]|nr:hypothetical protein PTI98_012149 [Pleurotus ostreatus]